MEDKFQQTPQPQNQQAEQSNSAVLFDANIINKIQEKANQNNQLMEQVNSLTKTLAQGTLSPEEQARLTPQQLRAIQKNDTNSIAQQIGMVKWTMSERGRQLNDSLKFFAETQARFREEQRVKKEEARRNIIEAIEMVGAGAFEGYSEADKRRIEIEAGFEAGFLSRATTSLQARERKAEEERQLQLEKERQQMELARRGIELDEQQFAFNKEMSRAELALSQAKLAEDKRQANMANARASRSGTQSTTIKQWGKLERVDDPNIKGSKGVSGQSLRFIDPTGAPVPMFEYFANNTGGDVVRSLENMVTTLKSSHSGDKAIGQELERELMKNKGQGVSQEFENKYSWLFKR